MADLLLELFSEEIPARMQANALEHAQKTLLESLAREGINIKAEALTGYVTPRRLAVWIKNLPTEQAATETEVKGPKTNAPEAALQGFLKKNNLTTDQLTEKDGVYFATLRKEGRQTAALLKTVIEAMLASFPWPKSMRWGAGETAWVRPLHNILCIFDGKAVPVSFAGLTANNTTYGHRFLSPAAITITTASEYESALEKAYVIANREKRKNSILAQARKAAQAAGLQLKHDEGLLEEVTGLVEYPVLLTGTIDAAYMDLPKEVLVSEMRAHQKYFALLKPSPSGRGQGEGPSAPPASSLEEEGALAPYFLITANITATDGGKAIIAGNERVLRARLADGRFFWDQDRKKPLSEWAEGLKSVTFHAKLGTIADKVERINKLAARLAPAVGADKAKVEKAARLCKADLVTGMVGEFPELQGVMGRYYAQSAKEDTAVADAIRDHYKPQGPSDALPTEPTAICVALADKLDTLMQMYVIGEKPTGSKDPFALRRSALGIIRIILENNLRLLLRPILQAAFDSNTQWTARGIAENGYVTQVNELLDFFFDRLKVQLKDQGIRHDVINAVVASGDDDLVRIVAKARALQDFLGTDDGQNLLAGYNRAANILAIEEKKDGKKYAAGELNAGALKEKEEITLAKLLPETQATATALLRSEGFVEAMKHIASLRAPIDVFFDKILVNCEDKALRENRLRLLSSIRESVDGIADFSRIEGDTKDTKKKAA